MTDRVVVQDVTEVSSNPTPGSELPAFRSEVLSRATFGASAARFAPETAVAPLPPNLAASLLAESLAGPWPPIDTPTFLVEVLRRDTAASGIVATGMDAFGDQPWPDAQRGVFAFRHDWSEPLVERLEWQTSVARLASGNELRHELRVIPRRSLSYRVGNARQTDALVADWLADHLGQNAWWPLPQYAVRMIDAVNRGALSLRVTEVDEQHYVPCADNLQLEFGNGWQYGWQKSVDRWVLIIAADGWQAAQINYARNDSVVLRWPLARAAAVGSIVMPLVCGRAIDAALLTQMVPGVVGGSVTANVAPSKFPDFDVLNDPLLDEIPVWPDGNWRDDPTAAAQATITRQDFSPADPWVRRDDPWPVSTYHRRYLASGIDAIDVWRARLWRTQGRLRAYWLPDGLAPVLRVISAASPDDGYLRISGDEALAFWHRPAACIIVHPDGVRQYALTATCHLDQGGVLVLRSGIGITVPEGSRVIRLVRCRLDHDAIDLYWHSPTLVEIALTARQLPEPRGDHIFNYLPF